MSAIVFSEGEHMSRPSGEFNIYPQGDLIACVDTAENTRRVRLKILVDRYGGLANLCEKLGFARKETSGLSRILNANVRHERDGEPYVMGSPTARMIETKLGLDVGWMDTPPTYEELDPDPQIAHLIAIARQLKVQERGADLAHLIQISDTFLEPPAKRANGE